MSETKTAVCLGNFDGVHIGHRRLLEQAVRTAQEKGLKPVAYTFSSHPLSLLGQGTLLLTLPDERRSLLMQAGVTPVEDDFAAVRDLRMRRGAAAGRGKFTRIFFGKRVCGSDRE